MLEFRLIVYLGQLPREVHQTDKTQYTWMLTRNEQLKSRVLELEQDLDNAQMNVKLLSVPQLLL